MPNKLRIATAHVQTDFRQLSGFTRTRLPGDNHNLVVCDRTGNLAAAGSNRKVFRISNVRDAPLASGNVLHTPFLPIKFFTLRCEKVGYHSNDLLYYEPRYMPKISNYTYNEITIGQTATYSKLIEERDVQLFAAVSGDVNPVHLDAAFAATTQFKSCIAHGMLSGAIISAAIAMELPGPGTIYLGQSLRFRLPVKLGDTITVNLEVIEKTDKRGFVTLDCNVFNQDEQLVVTGTAEVMAPKEKLVLERPTLPAVRIGD